MAGADTGFRDKGALLRNAISVGFLDAICYILRHSEIGNYLFPAATSNESMKTLGPIAANEH